MKLPATIKGFAARLVPPMLRSRAKDETGDPSYWLAGQPHAGQASEFESWPPTAQEDPPSPGNHQRASKSKSRRRTKRS